MVTTTLLLQRLDWIKAHYSCGAYYVVVFGEEHADKYAELIKECPQLNFAVSVEKGIF